MESERRESRESIIYEVFSQPEPEQSEREKKAGLGNQPLGESHDVKNLEESFNK